MTTKHPTLKGTAHRIVRNGPHGYQRVPVGAMLLPNGFHAQKCEDTLRARFPKADAFRVYGNDGCVFFCGSL